MTEDERTSFRSLIGTLQYAAVHSRPDVAAKIGELQSEVTRARVKHLILGKKVLAEAKQTSAIDLSQTRDLLCIL